MFIRKFQHDCTIKGKDFIVCLFYKGTSLNNFGQLIDVKQCRIMLKTILSDIHFEPTMEKLAIHISRSMEKFKLTSVELEKVRVYRGFRETDCVDYIETDGKEVA